MNEDLYLIVNKHWGAEGRAERRYPTEEAAVETLPLGWEQDYKIVRMAPDAEG